MKTTDCNETTPRGSLRRRGMGGRVLLFLLCALLGGGGSGCRTTVTTNDPAALVKTTSPRPLPWTSAFQRPSLLVADEIFVEGPADLLAHVAIVQDPLNVDYVTKTTEEGLRQELTLLPDRVRAEVRAQIDGWELVAMKRMVVLQRPGEVPVRVEARGEVWWAAADGSEEQRSDALEFQGERGR